jgi:hypothetical protein
VVQKAALSLGLTLVLTERPQATVFIFSCGSAIPESPSRQRLLGKKFTSSGILSNSPLTQTFCTAVIARVQCSTGFSIIIFPIPQTPRTSRVTKGFPYILNQQPLEKASAPNAYAPERFRLPRMAFQQFALFDLGAFMKHHGQRHLFSADEDARLRMLVAQFGDNNWKLIAHEMRGRSPRQCRERYKNYLSPDLSTRPWTESEDELLREKYSVLGPRWAKMTPAFAGRSDVALKNRWAWINSRPPPAAAPSEPEERTRAEEPVPVEPGSNSMRHNVTEFSISQLLWSSGERITPLKAELSLENEQRDSSFRNYGGKLW